jgi:hypothetical protein
VLCAEHNDAATTSLIEVWVDQTERRSWLLIETLDANQGEMADVSAARIDARRTTTRSSLQLAG